MKCKLHRQILLQVAVQMWICWLLTCSEVDIGQIESKCQHLRQQMTWWGGTGAKRDERFLPEDVATNLVKLKLKRILFFSF